MHTREHLRCASKTGTVVCVSNSYQLRGIYGVLGERLDMQPQHRATHKKHAVACNFQIQFECGFSDKTYIKVQMCNFKGQLR